MKSEAGVLNAVRAHNQSPRLLGGLENMHPTFLTVYFTSRSLPPIFTSRSLSPMLYCYLRSPQLRKLLRSVRHCAKFLHVCVRGRICAGIWTETTQ